MRELGYAVWRAAYAREVRTLVPEVADDDLVPAFAGVRAQAVGRDGALLDDFALEGSGGVLHVRNARHPPPPRRWPSPANPPIARASRAPRAPHGRTLGEMRILVTGASGAIGAALAPELAREGEVVRAYARDPRRVTCDGISES